MSEFIKNNPSAIEVFIFYEKEKKSNGEKLNKKIWNLIGKDDELTRLFDKMTIEDEEVKRKEIRQLVAENQDNLRLCILSDVIDKKSMSQSVLNIAKIIGTFEIDCQDFEFWFNRFSSGNHDLDQKTFSDLPLLIVGNIVENLDFRAQMRLREVSHGFGNIMDQVKPSADRIYFNTDYTSPQNTLNLSICNSKADSDRFWQRIYDGEDNLKEAFDGVMILLSNPRLRLECFQWFDKQPSEMSVQFIDRIKSLNHKIESKNLESNFNGDLMIDFVKTMKPGSLEQFVFHGKFEPIHIDRLAQLDQWKKAKAVIFNVIVYDFSRCLHHFQHFEAVFVKAESISMEDLLFVKKLFIQNDKLKSFAIVVPNKPTESEIVEALGLSELYYNEEEGYSFRLYDIPGSNDYLEVCIEFAISFARETSD